MTYTYDSRTVSDLHKDAYGFRPSVYYMVQWDKASPARKQEIWDGLLVDLDESIDREKQEAAYCVEAFEKMVAASIALGARDRQTALRWISAEDIDKGDMDVEHWVWQQGILFTDDGRKVMQELQEIWR